MDDLLDLKWSGSDGKSSNKSAPPNIPHKPSYLAGNRTASRKHNDAFADLLNMPSQNVPNHSHLPLAEQQRILHQQASYSSSPSLSARSSSPVQKPASSFDSLLDPFSGRRSGSPSTANMPMDSLRNSPRGFGSPTTQEQQNMQWNFDFLEGTTTSSSPAMADPFDPASLPVRQSAPPAFEDDDDDNPLGVLSKPAQKPCLPSTPSTPPAQHHYPSSSSSASPCRASSPRTPAVDQDDMLVAQLVDMGFSVEQAHVALEATGGSDLQLAIDLLVQNTEAIEIHDRPRRTQERRQSAKDTGRARQALFDDYDDDGQNGHPPRKPQLLSHQRDNNSNNVHPRRDMVEEDPASNVAFQQQKEKLVAQATEIGGFLYKNASMFVKAGRQRVSKAVEDWQEQQRADQSFRESGRPRWMREGTLDEEDQTVSQELYTERFVDDNSSDEDPELEKQRELAWKKQQETKQREYAIQARRQQHQRQNSIQEEDAYVSPSRRRNATPSSRRSTPVSTPLSSKNTFPPSKPNKRPRTRPLVAAAPDVMARANAARQLGNEKFKLGQFGEAEAAYSRAISILPPGHDHLVILNNNRAAARLKIGEYKKCIEDCTLAIEMANAGGDENCESEGVTIQWREQIIKALHRKGDALENIEKYKEAINTYEEILRYEGQSQKLNQALARCRRATNTAASGPIAKSPSSSNRNTGSAFPSVDYSIFDPEPAASYSSPPSPAKKSSSRPVIRSSDANVEKSRAVAAMRAQAAKQEAEEAERLEKTDDVNARIQQWKAGKENNLRALLATLDTLLWPGAQWRGAQMSELIEPKRCKIIYLKAIAKVHPDKLPSNATTEQRMLASSIFSTLNEAWDSFKSQI